MLRRTTRARSAAAAAATAGSNGSGSKQENDDGAHNSRPRRPPPADANADAAAAAANASAAHRDWRPRILTCLVSAQLLLALTPGLYRSTDFEVHRNWLAVTSSLPLAEWYRDATSPNATLDYPPLFAWFERALAAAARAVLPPGVARGTLRLQSEPHASDGCVLFQRLTVVVTGLALAGAAWWAGGVGGGGAASGGGKSADNHDGNAAAAAAALQKNLLFFLVTCNAGLLMVDNVHFQYNGWLLALLLASILLVERGGGVGLGGGGSSKGGSDDDDDDAENDNRRRRRRRPLYFFLASVAFSALLNAKHLFAYAAPAFFVYLLRGYVLQQPATGAASEGGATPATPATTTATTALARLSLLAAAVVAVFGASLGPFYAAGALPDLASRLFPFGRGLMHAYWAPNAWALYAALDKSLVVASAAARKAARRAAAAAAHFGGGGNINLSSPLFTPPLLPQTASMSGGVVGVAEFAVLPQVGPRAAAAATLLSMLPCLAALWRRPDARRFAAAVAHGCLCGFMFGYHVHEKAALTFLVPMALLAARPGGGDNGGGGGGGGWLGSRGAAEAEDKQPAAAAAAAAGGGGATMTRGKRRQGQEQQQQQLQRRQQEADADAAVDFLLASTAGHVGIFPLLFRPQEAALRWASALFYFSAAAWGLRRQQQLMMTQQQQQQQQQRDEERETGHALSRPLSYAGRGWRLAALYAAGCALLEAFNAALAPSLFPGLPFLPLLLTSVWCAWPIALVWARTTALWAAEALS